MRRDAAGAVLITVLFAVAAVARASSPDRWVEARSSHFVVLANTNEKDARDLALQFERMQMVFHTLFPTQSDDAGPPITVIAVKDRKGMQALEPEAYLAKDQMDLAGFFLRAPDRNYILVRLDAQQEHAYATVYHEYTHYMLRQQEGWLPLWFNEGLAQFYENTDFDEKNVWLGQANQEELRYLGRNNLLPIATLLAVDTTSPYYHEEEKGTTFYAESWALTHFLIVSDRLAGTHCIRTYVQLLLNGEDAVTAARNAFGDLDKLQSALSDYILQRKFMYFMMPEPLAAKDASIAVRQVPTAGADAVRADLLMYTGRTQESRALLESVLRDDPGNPLAHETMGLLEFHQGEIADATKWFGEAMLLDPHSYLAPYYYATTALRLGDKDQDEKIEASLRTSIQLNAEFAPAYDALAMFYALRHRQLNQAHTLILRAMQLEPQRLAYPLDCAEVLTQQRQFTDALEVLRAAKRLARSPKEIEAVESDEASVERYQTALAAWSSGQGAMAHKSEPER